jgi:hypothetical protein
MIELCRLTNFDLVFHDIQPILPFEYLERVIDDFILSAMTSCLIFQTFMYHENELENSSTFTKLV